MNQNINSLIVGPGAIGSLLCAHIQPYSNVWVHSHKPSIKLAREIISRKSIPLNWRLIENADQPIDLVWVCSKANNSEQSVSELLERHANAHAVLLHNGLGPQQVLSARFPGRIIYGMTTNAAYRDSNGVFKQTAFGQTYLNYPLLDQPTSQRWLTTINSWLGNLSFCIEPDIETALWRKLAINAVVNPLTAFYRIKNGGLLNHQYQAMIQNMCVEIQQVAEAEKITFAAPLTETVFEVIKLTAENYSSMNRDIYFQRPTELDFILGFLLAKASQHNITALNLEFWYQKIAALQQTYSEK